MAENGEPSCQRTGGSGFLERCDELGEGAVVNPAAVLRRRDGETDREMGLSDTGRSQQDDVLLALDEAELVEILDLFTLDGRLEREVELIERLDDGQAWVLPPLSVGEMTLRLYAALNYSQNSAHDLRRALNGA